MASRRFRKEFNYHEIRKYVTDPRTRKPIHLIEILPATATEKEIGAVMDRLDNQAASIKAGHGKIPSTLQRAYNEWARVIANQPVGRKRKLLTEGTQDHYKRVLTSFLADIPARCRKVTQLASHHVEHYNQSLLNRGRKARTVNANLTAIKSFSRWLSDHYGIDNFAAEVLMFTEDEPDQRFLTDDEYPLILKTGSSLFRQRFEFIGNTGVRATEFCRLHWADLQPGGQSIRVHGKGNKIRYVPLNSVCLRILDAIKKEQPPVGANYPIFVSKSNGWGNLGGPIGRRVLHLQCEPIATKLNIEPFGPHAFRHYFATELLLKGTPIAHVSKILGHRSIRTTETIYSHILPKHLTGITECLCG